MVCSQSTFCIFYNLQLICVEIENQGIKRVDHTKSLGLTIDDRLSWTNYINEVCKMVSAAIVALKRIRPFVSPINQQLYINANAGINAYYKYLQQN